MITNKTDQSDNKKNLSCWNVCLFCHDKQEKMMEEKKRKLKASLKHKLKG